MPTEASNRRLFIASFLTLIAAGMGFSVRGGILGDWSEQFGFTKYTLGEITGIGLAPFCYGIVVGSLLADRLGYKLLMVLAFVLHAGSAVVTLSATPVYGARGPEDAYLCLYWGTFLFALGNGVCESVINPLTATLYPNQKTHYLNILHAGWPGGLVLGGLINYCFVGAEAAIYQIRWEIALGLFLIPVAVYGLMVLKERFPVSEARAADVPFGRMLSVFASPMLWLLLLLHALVGYVELGTDNWIQNITGNLIGKTSFLLFIYTSTFMFILRFFAGPIVERINPVGLLFASAVLGACGLYMLSVNTTVASVFLAATVYGLGKTFLWPTMLGVVGERFPQGGALVMGAMGGIGMLSAGYLGAPGIGYKQDYYASDKLQAEAPATYERYKADEKKSFLGFLGFPPVAGIDGTKFAILMEEGKPLDEAVALLKERGKTDPKVDALVQWWSVAKPYAPADKPIVKEAAIHGGQMAFRLTALVPAAMAVGYLVLLFYFVSKGGYRVEVLHGHKPVGERYTGGVEGPVEG
ncbi:MAG: MFS transporter [Pirellulales bacterium]